MTTINSNVAHTAGRSRFAAGLMMIQRACWYLGAAAISLHVSMVLGITLALALGVNTYTQRATRGMTRDNMNLSLVSVRFASSLLVALPIAVYGCIAGGWPVTRVFVIGLALGFLSSVSDLKAASRRLKSRQDQQDH